MISSGLQTGKYRNKEVLRSKTKYRARKKRKKKKKKKKKEKQETREILQLKNVSTATPFLILFVNRRQFTRNRWFSPHTSSRK